MGTISDWFVGLFTLSGMAYFIAGYVSAYLIYGIYCMHKHKRLIINWRIPGIMLGITMIAFVSVQTQMAYTIAAKTAEEVQACQREFNATLGYRSRISEENDALSIEQRQLLADKDRAETEMWMTVLDPPAGISDLASDHPARQAWAIQVVQDYTARAKRIDERIDAIRLRQERLQADRAANPLPEATCGK
ncbi:membrane protein [Mycobacterium phage Aikoy]|uniref:Membrane protein n=1 Tax=Mycobacterium phage Onyinye TaxID=2686235 RepID=A0A6B9L750_9CAUD|nr:membrane protein [Mycobacterium phage Onyinye]QHB37456.1 membrane protein [Mycobacterium phage Onyinye]WKW85211.1 membrane protein [Mycobacterium phage Aikoy]